MSSIKEIGRICAGAYEDMQHIRKATMNRMRDVIRKIDQNISFDVVEEKKEEKTYEKEYQDAQLHTTLDKLKVEGKITQREYEYILENLIIANDSKKIENRYKKKMLEFVKEEKIFTAFLEKIKGLGEIMSAKLIKTLGYCERFDTISKLWCYCGLAVLDGEIQKRKKGENINYNPKMKTLAWQISDSFVKQRSPIYRKIYDEEKEKQLKKIKYTDKKKKKVAKDSEIKNKLHAELRARRKAVKIFLQHYWCCARELKGLEISKPWVIQHGGHTDYIKWQDVIKDV